MAKVVLDSVASGYDLSKINANFQTLATALENTLSRDGTIPNSMSADLDMNGQRILNAVADGGNGFIWKGAWLTATSYAMNNLVSESGNTYICLSSHTSGVFATDLATGKWELVASKGSSGAGTGDLISTNNLSELTDIVAARTNLGVAIGVQVQAYDADIPIVAASQAEMETGTETALRSMSPLRVAQAITASASASKDQVARDQIALTNMRLMLTSSITTGELVQGKQWELSTDEWGATSTNETYNAPGTLGYYNNSGGYTTDQVPTMTSISAPSGTVTKSTELSATYASWKAFDKSAGTWWQPSTTGTEWLAYEWASSKTITQYTLKCAVNAVDRGPSAWTFAGWNGSSWVTLHTGSETSWSVGQLRTYAVTNSTAYAKYRINMTAIAGGAAAYEIVEIAMMESIAPPNMTLLPPSTVSVSVAPVYIDVYALWKDDSGSASLGTDLTLEASRDGGTTYTAGTVSNLASYGGTYSIIRGRVDASAQPSGTAMLCRIKTLNNKAQRVGAPALYSE